MASRTRRTWWRLRNRISNWWFVKELQGDGVLVSQSNGRFFLEVGVHRPLHRKCSLVIEITARDLLFIREASADIAEDQLGVAR